MPKGLPPATFQDLLESRQLGHLATVDAAGHPRVNPIWFLWEEPYLLIGVLEDTLKYRNLRRNPWLALSIADPADQSRYLELRGEVIEFERYDNAEFVNRLSRKYTGADYQNVLPGQIRYKLTVRIEGWSGQ